MKLLHQPCFPKDFEKSFRTTLDNYISSFSSGKKNDDAADKTNYFLIKKCTRYL